MPANLNPAARPTTASLDNPFYYLENFQTVLLWILNHHHRLLIAQEMTQLQNILALPQQAQALLARMVMRKGELFRSDKLVYAEIGSIETSLTQLSEAGLIDIKPALQIEELIHLLRRDELLSLCKTRFSDCNLPASSSKTAISVWLMKQASPVDNQSLQHYWPNAPLNFLRLRIEAVMERVRLMFFGNLRQDWSEFVLTELGHQRYEVVNFSAKSSAFGSRADVDIYLQMHSLGRALENGESPASLLPKTPPPQTNPWLESRRQRLLFSLAKAAEAIAELRLAISCYRDNPQPEAQVRYFRLMEKQAGDTALLQQLHNAMQAIQQPEALLHLTRIQQRLNKKLGGRPGKRRPNPITTLALELDYSPHCRVETATLEHFHSETQPVFYVENRLFNGMLGLLLWPALFAPEPGAFFHPFQSGPADLYRNDFVARRPRIAQQMALLDSDEYAAFFRRCWRQKQGLSCSLIQWSGLTEDLLEAALLCIPAKDLKAIFQHMLLDLRQHRRGFPDLIQFDLEQQRYRLIEVKGPGDRLQDHQRLWLEFFQSKGMDIAVAHIRWRAESSGRLAE